MKLFVGFITGILILSSFSTVYAGGSHTTNHSDSYGHTITPTVATTPTSVIPVNPNSIAQNATQNESGGGNGQIYCSGPTAPGWVTGVEGGGCHGSTTIIHLNDLPYTGLTGWNAFWEFVVGLYEII